MLSSETLIYTNFTDPRTKNRPGFVGGSGPLLMAEDTCGKKYIVKYQFPHVTANEYTASWLAQMLNVYTPKAYILTPTKERPHAVAIEFMDLRPFDKKSVPNVIDLIGQFALNIMTCQEDILQLNQVGDRIISYDFGETFCISDYEMRLLPRSVSHFLSLFQRRISICDFNYPSLAKEFNIDPEYQKREILNVARRVMQITEDDILQLETELNTIFQPVIAQYYVGCIRILQNRISRL